MEFDRGDDRPYRGLAARGGVAISSIADINVIAQYWPGLQGLRGRSLQLEVSVFPAGRLRVAPYLLTGVGVFDATAAPGSGRTPFSGVATTVGLGFHGRVAGGWGVRVEGMIRFDARSFDDELRLWTTYAPAPRSRPARWGRPRVTPEVAWMVALTGPWRFAEPAYGLSFETPVGVRDAVELGLAVAHLRIHATGGGGAWDTRTVVLRSGWRRALTRGGELALESGPLMTLMLEGPDDGVRGGGHLRLSVAPRSTGPRPAVTAGVMWVVRPAGREGVSPADQRAVTLSAGLSF